jgi:hypothetical protein
VLEPANLRAALAGASARMATLYGT